MIEAVFQLLYRFDGVISENQIRRALGIHSKQDSFELTKVLNSDQRFECCSENKWRCADIGDIIEDKPLDKVCFTITDIETTGSIRGKDRIIEIAAIKARNGEIIDTFESLINPHRIISKQISKLTHITNTIVKDSPPIETVMPEFIDFMDDGVFVAHNSLFDFCFISSEIRRIGVESFKNQIDICTYRLARKLLPDVRARGISGLSLYFDYPMKNRHRAMPDVMATHFFLNKFLGLLREKGVTTLHQLIDFQKDRIGKKELKKKLNKQKKKNYRVHFRN